MSEFDESAMREEDEKRVDDAVARLREHFDSVHIFVTRHEDDIGTINCNRGAGNWFARLGQVRDWLIRRDEETRVDARPEDDE